MGNNLLAKKLPNKWKEEKKSIKAVQVAFDLGDKIQYFIRREALDMAVNPTDRVRQILDLHVSGCSVRPRLSISLTQTDFPILAKKYNISADDRVAIKKKAAEELITYVEARNVEKTNVETRKVETMKADEQADAQ